MSKAITIKVNGVATNLSVDKLRTATEAGGSTDWIPEEDMEVATLHVWRNGTYNAEDFGVYGFDKVRVAVTGRGGAGAELEGAAHVGDPIAHDPVIMEGEEARTMGGTKRLKVNLQGGGTMTFIDLNDTAGTLSATKNAVYSASNDKKYAYTSVTVNVPESEWESEGGGDDPFDPDNLPNALLIDPWTFVYNDGDSIVLEYGDAKAYVARPNPYGGTDYTLWTHSSYPGGKIPINEISYSPMTAVFSDADYVSSDLELQGVTQPIPINSAVSTGDPTPYISYGHEVAYYRDVSGVTFLLIVDTNMGGFGSECHFLVACSDNPDALYHNVGCNGWTDTKRWDYYADLPAKYTHHGKTVYLDCYLDVFDPIRSGVPVNGNHTAITNSSRQVMQEEAGPYAWTAIYGEVIGHSVQIINATWKRPYDGQELSTKFRIMVYPAGHDIGGGEIIGEGGTQQ